jgi:RNA polymerase sigma-70 factor (ECF subfamily)
VLFEDEAAFRAWYETALPRVYGYLFQACGGMRAVAEELTQEALVDAIRHRNAFDGRSDPITWVVAIARHKLVNHARRAHRERRPPARVRDEQRGPGPTPVPQGLDRDTMLRALGACPRCSGRP